MRRSCRSVNDQIVVPAIGLPMSSWILTIVLSCVSSFYLLLAVGFPPITCIFDTPPSLHRPSLSLDSFRQRPVLHSERRWPIAIAVTIELFPIFPIRIETKQGHRRRCRRCAGLVHNPHHDAPRLVFSCASAAQPALASANAAVIATTNGRNLLTGFLVISLSILVPHSDVAHYTTLELPQRLVHIADRTAQYMQISIDEKTIGAPGLCERTSHIRTPGRASPRLAISAIVTNAPRRLVPNEVSSIFSHTARSSGYPWRTLCFGRLSYTLRAC